MKARKKISNGTAFYIFITYTYYGILYSCVDDMI